MYPPRLGRVFYVQVSYSCLTVPLLPPGAPIVGADFVGASYIEENYLFEHVRERLGAYGAWSRTNDSGLISFISYRAPKALETLTAFRATPSIVEAWAETANEDQLLEAVLPFISLLDAPDSMEARGRQSFWQWVDKETPRHRATFRSQVINANREQIKEFAAKLKEAFATKPQALALFGPETAANEIINSGETLQLTDVA